jgi:signal transduction histidine kinase
MTLVKEHAYKEGVALESNCPDGLPMLRADDRKVKQILLNLLSNAIKFTEAGGRVELRSSYRAGEGHVFRITDTGIGIAKKDISRALTPFRQIDDPLNRKYEGTGLGLPLAKSLVEMHGGSLELESEPGVGTTVTVRFPAERVIREPESPSATAS